MKYPYPQEFYDFLVAFNEQEFYVCHDLLEEIWLTDRSNTFVKGLLHLSVAHYHDSYGNSKGTRLMMQSAKDYLTPYMPFHWDIDVCNIIAHIENCQSIIPHSEARSVEKVDQQSLLPYLLIEQVN
ncbi:DUF309 domain-containing protein [Alkalihalobacillus sp. CinArs1]|uniref:DUF309 domain-containing protein n=1 Tax=Alkalihalobacillus sp. CinArs1 TaxID=2995314 RepID=UPI0022DE099C|nr:DUF309 domain-containing protein [Alkalihalobacillus sp. CinArs1]